MHKSHSRSRTTAGRVLAAAMALVSVVATRPVSADPSDIFSIGAPLIGTPAPKAADQNVGDSSVSPTGAFQYSYPIKVPPGRNGMQPALSLSYSSQAPIYGGLAAGWSIGGLHLISLDTSDGRMIYDTGGVPKRYTSSMAGGRPLIPVTEATSAGVAATLRAQNDTSWTRYEQMVAGSAFRWRAYSPDGTTFYFGDTDHISNCGIVSDEWAPITRAVDKFGNAIDYFWKAGPESECRIDHIRWGQNSNAAVQYFAAAVFNFAEMPLCGGVPIGSQISYRTGTKIGSGTSRLNSITIAAFAPGAGVPPQIIPTTPEHTRQIALTYDSATEACNAKHGAFRSLASIQETASGIDSPSVTLPAVRFTYGRTAFGQDTLSWAVRDWVSYSSGPPWEPSPTVPELAGTHYNLGWGYRFTNGQWPTVEAMMIDVDGDGLLDRLSNAPTMRMINGQWRTWRCRAQWERNQGLGLPFAPPKFIEMPTLKWATADEVITSQPFTGGEYAGDNSEFAENAVDGKMERCALNYQLSGYVNSYLFSGSGEACPTTETCNTTSWRCSGGLDDCSDKNGQKTKTILAYRWMDIDGDQRVDLVASPVDGGITRYNLRRGNGLNGGFTPAPEEPTFYGLFPQCPPQSYTAFPANDPNRPYTMCGGMFPYFVYRNHGNGVFGAGGLTDANPMPDFVTYQPMPLETTNGDSTITASPVASDQGIVDLDGDGYPDAAKVTPVVQEWMVFRNGQDSFQAGKFLPRSGTTPYYYDGAQTLSLTAYNGTGIGVTPVVQVQGTLDVNGDGLLDHWMRDPSTGNTILRRNNGIGFGVPPINLSKRPGTDGKSEIVAVAPGTQYPSIGNRVDKQRVIDVDADGRADFLLDPTGGTSLQVHFNQGGEFTGPVGSVAPLTATEHRIVVSNNIRYYWPAPNSDMYSWEIRGDMMDLDGDGIAEGVFFGQAYFNPGDMDLWKIPTPTQPPRLLAQIDNGRGATTAINYATTTSSTVQQDPATGKTSPHVQWVVQSHTTTDSLNTPITSSTTAYKYRFPRFAPDDHGRYGLRGFERIETTLPSGAMREDHYSFTPDWSGRLAKSIMHPLEAISQARTIDVTTWQERQLFGGALKTYHPTVTEHLVCANGQTESTCTPSSAPGYTKTTSTLTALTAGGAARLWAETMSVTQMSPTSGLDGERRTDTTYVLVADATNYRLVKTIEQNYEMLGNVYPTSSASVTTWTSGSDSSYRVPYSTQVYIDLNNNISKTTRRTYDLQTGNVLQIWKPEQWAANQNTTTNLLRTTFAYDSRKLFVATETNELGHVRDFSYEYGTGTKLRTMGPNVPACVLGPPYPACPAGAPLKEDHRIRVDGLGRMIERYEVFANPGETTYRTYVVETNSYVNGPAASITHRSAIDNTGTTVRYKQTRTDLDGHGRPIREVVDTGPSPIDQVTRYVYNNAGNLIEVQVPDPSLNDATLVSYVYTFDSLGRALSIRRPDATLLTQRSGVDMAYDGLTTTTTEVVGAALGQGAVTTTKNDALGRLVQVDEQLNASPLTWSTTTYAYSPRDEVSKITDPEGIVTTLGHDMAGRRTSITRGGRTWLYGYDRNDNQTSETPPCTGAGCQASYVSTTAYDALDRPISALNAPRNLSGTDQALFGSSSETFSYDGGWNGKGRLHLWQSFAPGASTPSNSSSMTWNVQGDPMQLTHTFNAAGYTNQSRSQLRFYNIGGQLEAEYLGGVVAGSTTCTDGSHATHAYDDRGLELQISINGCLYGSSPPYSYVTNTRNVAGLVTKRNSIAGNGPFHYVESNWSFDKLGRVSSQVVKKGAALDQVVAQHLTYFGNDDPKSLDHYLGLTNHKLFNFGYDKRHQLTTVTESALPNAFTATYGYGVAGRFATAIESAAALPNSDVKARNVTYLYDTTDRERLLTLRKNPGTKNLADYTYDEPGNLLSRYYPDTKERWDFVYDGKNQLRRVTKKVNNSVTGSEEYWYDENGTRTTVVRRNSSGAVTGATGFILNAEWDYNAAGDLTKSYAHVKLGTTAVRLERTGNGPASVEYQFHGLGDHMLAGVSQGTGAINASFMYAPFGEIVEATNAGGASNGIAAHRRRMNDKLVDEISDLGYYGFRYYDKLSITWSQSDPLYRFAPDRASTKPRGANLYTAHLNNPLRYVDPDGREPDPAGIQTNWLAATGKPMTDAQFDRAVEIMTHMAVNMAVDAALGGLGDLYSAGEALVAGDGWGVAVAVVAAVVPGLNARSLKHVATGGVSGVTTTTANTSRAARREAQRQAGIPTSQQPISQSKNASGREFTHEVPKAGGGTEIKSVQDQTLDASHPGDPHWEAGSVKTDPATGEVLKNKHGRPKLKNEGKAKVSYPAETQLDSNGRPVPK